MYLLAPTRKAIPNLLHACSDYAHEWCIKYNEKKTNVMYFGENFESFTCTPLLLNNEPLEFVRELKYLGVVLKTENGFLCSTKKTKDGFLS